MSTTVNLVSSDRGKIRRCEGLRNRRREGPASRIDEAYRRGRHPHIPGTTIRRRGQPFRVRSHGIMRQHRNTRRSRLFVDHVLLSRTQFESDVAECPSLLREKSGAIPPNLKGRADERTIVEIGYSPLV